MTTKPLVVTKAILDQHKLSEEEYQKILHILGRDPNWTELACFPRCGRNIALTKVHGST